MRDHTDFAGSGDHPHVVIRPVITLVHSTTVLAPSRGRREGTLADLDRCDPSEGLLDVLLNDVSILHLGAKLPDPIRIIDAYVAERFIRASRWGVAVPLHRAADSLTSVETFVFAQDLIERGFEQVSRDAVKNSIKRLRAVFRLIVPAPRDWFIRYEGPRGYLVDLNNFIIRIVHLPQ
jgi:hypothetical protein